ncbi:MAG: BON domain-containing protein [Azonexus sp.]
MNIKLAASCLTSLALMLPIAGYAADAATPTVGTMVKDSVITTKIKSELAAEKVSSLVHISVDTDHKGAVILGGTATSKTAVERAVSIAKGVKGVTSVDNQIKIVADK